MKKNLFKIITVVLFIIFLVLLIILVSMKVVNGKEREEKDLLLSKVTDELKFIDYNVIDAMNKINNITVTRYKVFTKTVNNGGSNTGNVEDNSSESSKSQENSEGGDSQGSSEGNSSEGSDSQGGNGNSPSNMKSSEKEDSEKEYNLSIVNSLTETDKQEPDWDKVTNVYESLVATWPTTQLDLKKAGISEEYLENVNINLNGIAQSILNKNKNGCLVNLYNLYTQIPTYMEIISKDTYTIDLYKTKMSILNAYSLANNDNKWDEMTASIKVATTQFENLLNAENNEKEKNNLEKIYSMLKNLESTVALNNRNIFYMQYKNIMQEFSNL